MLQSYPWKGLSTTYDSAFEKRFFQIIHPFHPLRGCRFELIACKQAWGEDRVYFYDDEGRLKAVPTSWTDACEPDSFNAISAGRAHFRMDDLVALVDLLDNLNKKLLDRSGVK